LHMVDIAPLMRRADILDDHVPNAVDTVLAL
jgi:hypothetical protein